jgi:DNA-binding IclR family transcriptional regulator
MKSVDTSYPYFMVQYLAIFLANLDTLKRAHQRMARLATLKVRILNLVLRENSLVVSVRRAKPHGYIRCFTRRKNKLHHIP